MKINTRAQLAIAAGAVAGAPVNAGRQLSTHWLVECFGPDGKFKWADEFDNLVVTAGLNDSLDKHLKGSAYTAAWYVGLADGTPTFAAGDTMAAHGGWTEIVAYDEAVRQTLTLGAVAERNSNTDRDGVVTGGRMATYPKWAGEQLDYSIDWSDRLATAEAVNSATWAVDAGITEESTSHTDTTTVITLSGGTAGKIYACTCTMTTSAGRVMVETFEIFLRGAQYGFCTFEDVEHLLQVAISTAAQISSIIRAIEEATAAIQNYTHQEIQQSVDDAITLDVAGNSTRLYLPELPVTAVASVVEDGETLTEGSDEDYQLGQWGVLHRVSGNWAAGVQIVTVTYTHGYATIPDDVAAVCTRAAARAYQAGLRASEMDGVPGVQAESLGDHSITYSSEGGGGIGEGVLGASASRMLLLSEKDMLNRYRYVAL